jgi:hypothetical protein
MLKFVVSGVEGCGSTMTSPANITFHIRFSIGQQHCVATLSLEQGEDAHDVLKKFLQQENIPIYLHDNILSSVMELLYEEKKSQIALSENSTVPLCNIVPFITLF